MNESVNESLTYLARARELVKSDFDALCVVEPPYYAEILRLLDKAIELLSKQ